MKFTFAKTVVVRNMDDGSVMLLDRGQIYRVHGVAAAVVVRLRKGETIESISEDVGRKYKVQAGRVRTDAQKLVNKLVEFGLIQKATKKSSSARSMT